MSGVLMSAKLDQGLFHTSIHSGLGNGTYYKFMFPVQNKQHL